MSTGGEQYKLQLAFNLIIIIISICIYAYFIFHGYTIKIARLMDVQLTLCYTICQYSVALCFECAGFFVEKRRVS